MKSDDTNVRTETASSKISSKNDETSDEVSYSITEMTAHFFDEVFSVPLYANPLSSSTEIMLNERGWKLALTLDYIQETVRSDPPSPVIRLLAEMRPNDKC